MNDKMLIVIVVIVVIYFWSKKPDAAEEDGGAEDGGSGGGGGDGASSEDDSDYYLIDDNAETPPSDRMTGGGGGGTSGGGTGALGAAQKAGGVLGELFGSLLEDDDEDDEEPPEPEPGPAAYGSPDNPTEVPTQGMYYRCRKGVKAGDACKMAGLEYKHWRKLRDHPKNAWIPTKFPGGKTFVRYTKIDESYPATFVGRWFDPEGYQTTCRFAEKPGLVWGVAYIPFKAEVV